MNIIQASVYMCRDLRITLGASIVSLQPRYGHATHECGIEQASKRLANSQRQLICSERQKLGQRYDGEERNFNSHLHLPQGELVRVYSHIKINVSLALV